MDQVYNSMAKWPSYFPSVDETGWTQAGYQYMQLTGADLTMFVDDILSFDNRFQGTSFTTYFNSQLEFMVTKITEYKEINKATNVSSMNEALTTILTSMRISKIMLILAGFLLFNRSFLT